MDDGRDSVRSRSPLSPRIVNPSVANGQKEDAAQRTEHPRLGIEMAEIDKGPELGVEAQTLLPLETTVRTAIICVCFKSAKVLSKTPWKNSRAFVFYIK